MQALTPCLIVSIIEEFFSAVQVAKDVSVYCDFFSFFLLLFIIPLTLVS